jgi:hypothetical protein
MPSSDQPTQENPESPERWTQEEVDRASERIAELRKVIRVLPPNGTETQHG